MLKNKNIIIIISVFTIIAIGGGILAVNLTSGIKAEQEKQAQANIAQLEKIETVETQTEVGQPIQVQEGKTGEWLGEPYEDKTVGAQESQDSDSYYNNEWDNIVKNNTNSSRVELKKEDLGIAVQQKFNLGGKTIEFKTTLQPATSIMKDEKVYRLYFTDFKGSDKVKFEIKRSRGDSVFAYCSDKECSDSLIIDQDMSKSTLTFLVK